MPKPKNFSQKVQNTKKSKIFGVPKIKDFRGFGSRKSQSKEDFLGRKKKSKENEESSLLEKSFLEKKPRKEDENTSKRKEEKLKKLNEEESQRVEIDLSEERALEEVAETPQVSEKEADDFSEFMLSSETSEISEMPTLTLPSSNVPETSTAQNLEDIGAASSIATAPEPTIPRRENDYIAVYNEPSYMGGMSEEKIIEGFRRSERSTRTVEQLRDIRPEVMIEDWHETGEVRERTRSGEDLRDYVVTEVERREEEHKLPFEQKKKYRELKR